jgi:septum formation protein
MKIILASQSLRRRQLLEEIGFAYDLRPKDVEESYPGHLQCEEIVEYLSEKKSLAFTDEEIPDDTLVPLC